MQDVNKKKTSINLVVVSTEFSSNKALSKQNHNKIGLVVLTAILAAKKCFWQWILNAVLSAFK